MEEVLKWWCSAGLIAFGLTWLGLAILCIAALVFDCWEEPERKLTTPIPIDLKPNETPGCCGLMESEISTRANGGLMVRRKVRVG